MASPHALTPSSDPVREMVVVLGWCAPSTHFTPFEHILPHNLVNLYNVSNILRYVYGKNQLESETTKWTRKCDVKQYAQDRCPISVLVSGNTPKTISVLVSDNTPKTGALSLCWYQTLRPRHVPYHCVGVKQCAQDRCPSIVLVSNNTPKTGALSLCWFVIGHLSWGIG